jgi:hypothetical protein
MKTAQEIKNIALERLQEAAILCDNEKYDGAFYLAGYSVELMLKAKICERFDVDNLFDETSKDISKVRNAVKIHDISLLLVFSGLRNKLEKDKSTNDVLESTINKLFDAQKCLWSELNRYQTIGSQNPDDVKELISLLLDKDGLIQWIQNN